MLVDESIIGETGVTERDFFVIMVTKEKPVTQAAPSAAATAAPAPVTQSPQSTFEPTTPQVVIPGLPFIFASLFGITELSPEIRQIIDMGFPESEARAALLASNGNSSLAIEYLMSGAPIPLPPSQVAPASDLDQLRHHPQINHLRSLLQQNPGAIGQVLQEIGN